MLSLVSGPPKFRATAAGPPETVSSGAPIHKNATEDDTFGSVRVEATRSNDVAEPDHINESDTPCTSERADFAFFELAAGSREQWNELSGDERKPYQRIAKRNRDERRFNELLGARASRLHGANHHT